MSKAAIIGKIQEIAQSSFFNDSCAQYYAVHLIQEPDARIELSFIQLPFDSNFQQ
jgi:hypothetical protein